MFFVIFQGFLLFAMYWYVLIAPLHFTWQDKKHKRALSVLKYLNGQMDECGTPSLRPRMTPGVAH